MKYTSYGDGGGRKKRKRDLNNSEFLIFSQRATSYRSRD